MCYSATASFAAATILTIIGVITLKKTNNKKYLLLASIPLLFAIQQAAEGVVWLTFDHAGTSIFHSIGIYTFLIFAMIVWPTLTPSALMIVESNKQRKRAILITFLCGLAFALHALQCMLRYSITAQIVSCHIMYDSAAILPFSDLFYLVWYSIATIAPIFLSSLTYAWVFGLSTTIALIFTYFIMKTVLVSVWCFFAALLSMLILLIIVTNDNTTKPKRR